MKLVRLLSATTSAALQQCVEQSIKTWLAEWSMAKAPIVSVEVSTAMQLEAISAAAPVVYTHPVAGAIQLHADEDAWQKLLFSDQADLAPADDISAQLEMRARQDLVGQLLGALGFRADQIVADRATPVAASSDSGSAVCSVQVDSTTFAVVLESSALTQLERPKPTGSTLPLSARQQAVIDSSCTISVTLDLGELPLAHLKSLAVGDTLMSDTPLNTPFTVGLGDKLRLQAHLGSYNNSKAVYLTQH